jgi:hypothetical protein
MLLKKFLLIAGFGQAMHPGFGRQHVDERQHLRADQQQFPAHTDGSQEAASPSRKPASSAMRCGCE